MSDGWIRVNKRERCVVCKHPDWCTYNPKLNLALCMRIQSTRPSRNAMGGWLHRLDTDLENSRRYPIYRPEEPTINCGELLRRWSSDGAAFDISRIANSLGVSRQSLIDLRVVWAREHRAWAWPMRDGYGNLTGFRLRSNDGRKWSVKGGHEGLFLPWLKPQRTMWITEGATDTAAGLSLGLYAVGRPSCSGGVHHLTNLVSRLGITRVVIMPDCDDDTEREQGFNPGLRGATGLRKFIRVPTATLVLPCKDLREFLRSGGTTELIESQLSQLVWQNNQGQD